MESLYTGGRDLVQHDPAPPDSARMLSEWLNKGENNNSVHT